MLTTVPTEDQQPKGEHRFLDPDAENVYKDLVHLAAYVCDTPIAAVSLVDEHLHSFKSIVGMDVKEIPLDLSFCAHAIRQTEMMVVPDALADPRFADNPFVSGYPHLRFYAGMPLITQDGRVLGTLCVLDREPRNLSTDQREALLTLTRQIVTQIELAKLVAFQGRLIEEREQAQATQAEAQERTAQLLAVASSLGGTLNTAEVADVILQAALPIFRASMGLVVLLDEDGATLRTAGVIGVSDEVAAPWQEFSVEAAVPLACAVREQRLILLPTDVDHDEDYAHLSHERAKVGEGALVAVPLLVGECCVGGLGLICPTERCQREEQQTFLWTLARQCALALERARLYDGAQQELEERQRGQEALHESNRALRESQSRLVEAQRIGGIGDWELTLGLDLEIVKIIWSAEMFRLMEFDPAHGEPPYAAVQARYHPDDRIERNRVFAEALAMGEPYQCDLRLILPSGTPRWCHLVGRPVLDAQGQVMRIAGTALDITERMEREQRVREANTHLELQKAQLQAANAELEALATTDPLTGLLNHRAYYARLEEEEARAKRENIALAVVMLDLDNFKFFNDAYGHAVGDAVLRQVAERLMLVCRPYDTVARFGGDEFALILAGVGQASAAELAARLRRDLAGVTCQVDGEEVIPISLSVGVALLNDTRADRHEALRKADERLLRSKTGGDAETEADSIRAHAGRSLEGFSMLDALVAAVDNKDRYTRRHSEDVMDYSLLIGRELGLDEATLDTVAVAALLHDVGKIGVPDAILRKPGKLTQEEFEAVKRHPQMGAVMVGAAPGLERILDAVRYHHERWDGGGYPSGLKGEETPLIARLMAVADAFSAMTTDRPYRQSMSSSQALALLEAGAGTQWDPACVHSFRRACSFSDSAAAQRVGA